MWKKNRVGSILSEEEISRLRSKLSESQRKSKAIGIVSVVLISFLLVGWFASYQYAYNQAEMSRFEFYYAGLTKQRYGVDKVESFLDGWYWITGTYAEGEFDCSEMSAYIEWRLENAGFHTIIVTGQSPSNPEAKHAWLLVETSSGKYMPVEATEYALVKWQNQYFDQYFDYDHSFETILEALDYQYDDFNWWES